MLQLIGWLGCVYLIVKAFEIGSSAAFRDASGNMRGAALVACLVALVAAVVFAVAFAVQGSGLSFQTSAQQKSDALSASITAQCIELAKTPEDLARCRQ